MLYALIAIAIACTFMSLYSKNALMGIVGTGAWLAVTYWFNTNLPGMGVAVGTPLFDVIIISSIGASIASFVIPVLQDNESDARQGFSIRRFINHGDIGNRNAPRPHRETPEEYNAKIYAMLHPNGKTRRRR